MPWTRRPPSVTAGQVRQMQVSEFAAWLRTQANKHKRPFQEQTIACWTVDDRSFGGWGLHRVRRAPAE